MKILTNKFFILGNLLLLLIAIPITLFFVKQQQNLTSKAAPSSRLYFAPATITTSTSCPSFTLDVMVDPGTNLVSFVTPVMTYDPTKVEITQITPASTGFKVNPGDEAKINNGEASITIDVTGGDVTNVLRTVTKIATVTFVPKSEGTTQILMDSTKSTILAQPPDVNNPDPINLNQLSTVGNATATIGTDACTTGGGTPAVTPEVTPGTTPPVVNLNPTISATPTPIGSGSATITPTIAIPTPTLFPTATPTLIPTPTAVPTVVPTAVPTVAPTGSFAGTVGIISAVLLAILGGFALLAL